MKRIELEGTLDDIPSLITVHDIPQVLLAVNLSRFEGLFTPDYSEMLSYSNRNDVRVKIILESDY